jgi:Thoeris protein ThsB, TIR-like domain
MVQQGHSDSTMWARTAGENTTWKKVAFMTTTQWWKNQLARAELRKISESFSKESATVVRHKCFLSYHSADATEVLDFVESFDDVFIPKAIGVSDDDPFIDSYDTDYVMDHIRDKYLANSTVTIVLIGACTWSRKYVDWEVYSSLRRDSNNRLIG